MPPAKNLLRIMVPSRRFHIQRLVQPARRTEIGRAVYTQGEVNVGGVQMAVYVDDMRARYRRMIMCHMVADTEVELHAMADAIGVARRWHQGDHYDICLSKRKQAVAAGAVEITWRQASAIIACQKRKLTYASPEDAVRRFLWLSNPTSSSSG